MKQFIVEITVRLLIVVAPFLLAACGSKHDQASDHSSDLATAQVNVQKVESLLRPMTEEVVGTVRAKLHATLASQVSGRIDKMPVVLGDKIQKGQLVAHLDAAEIGARLEQAEASLEQAEREWKRVASLFEQQSVTRVEYDSAQSRQRIARGAVAEARAMMAYVEVTAPFDGVVTRKWADVGDLAAPGKPLVDLEDPSALQIEADVPEAIASQIRRDARLTARVDAINGDVAGLVREIAPSADPASRTFRVKLELPQTAGLMPGQFARLLVPIGENKSVHLPAAAVVQRGQLEIVFTVTNQHAQMHLVKSGKRSGDEIEILSGLEVGENVVVSGGKQLIDGQPVEVK